MLIQTSPSDSLQKLLSHISKFLFLVHFWTLCFIDNFPHDFNSYISAIVVEYLSKLYCICVIWTSRDIDQISLQSTTFLAVQSLPVNSGQLVWLKVGIDQQDVDEKVRLGLDVGCQVKECECR